MYFVILTCLILVAFARNGVAADDCDVKQKVVCYFGSWAYYRDEEGQFTTNDIDPTLCTDIIYSFAGLNLNLEVTSLDSNVDITRGGYTNVTSIKDNYPCIKILLAIGGWNEGSIKYSVAAATEDSRKRFVDSALRFVAYYNFDGINLDWEYPTSRGGVDVDKDNVATLVQELKAAFQPWNFQVSMAVAVNADYYNIEKLKDSVDYVYIMGYDLVHSDSETTGLLAPFTPIKSSLQSWLDKGLPSSKLVLGIPAYGRCFNLADANNHDIGAPTTKTTCGGPYTDEDGFLAFYEIQVLVTNGFCGGTVVSDDNAYSWCDNEWITYDNEETIATKAQYVRDSNLAGIMMWSLDTDDFLGTYGEKYTLLRTAYNTLTA
ncbi:hypothetical protein GWI33_018078 [Rhynchophorus ferrugineus]|uniref:GH18 domain-containing protein n=1 Tax=Rhynchophorus ferrugineus TaxID=354439 RepID=A0A834M8D3_RHYFE|nr:hypothetical protein GWI33_018078 [Rhynchophorus ferrugineus]